MMSTSDRVCQSVRNLIVLLLFMVGAAPAVFAQDAPGDYRIGAKDLLEIKVLEIPDLNVERRVSDNGAIDLPLLGQILIGGKTASEAQNALEELLRAKYVNRANVSIIVKEFANRPISVVGAVSKPGTLNVSGKWTLLQALSAAGGVDQSAGRRIYVLRTANNGLSDVLEIRRDDLFQASTMSWNIPIYAGDIVNVPARSTVRVFCLGEVRTPGAVEFDSDDRITVLSVIAKAGGLTDRASKTILIKRRRADGKDLEIRVNYKAIIAGRDPDPPLKTDDVIVVSESFF